MNNSAMIIEWDDNDKRQIEEAKEHYRKARSEGRVITDIDHNVIQHFRPSLSGIIIKEKELKENEFAVRVFDETGDRRLIWDMLDPDQIKEAANLFNEYIGKGWRAYTVDDSGKSRRRIHKFDIEKQEILFEDKAVSDIFNGFVSAVKKDVKEVKLVSEKIANFVKAFKNTKLVPRTYPG